MITLTPDVEDEDWPKRTWDLYTSAGVVVTTLPQLRQVLGWSDERLVHLLDLPVGRAIPPLLRSDLIRLRQQQ